MEKVKETNIHIMYMYIYILLHMLQRYTLLLGPEIIGEKGVTFLLKNVTL